MALLAELDAIRVPGHPDADPVTGAAHACGHHAQGTAMIGAAAGLTAAGVLNELAGNIVEIKFDMPVNVHTSRTTSPSRAARACWPATAVSATAILTNRSGGASRTGSA